MKAWVLHSIGDIRLEEIEEPALKNNEALVAVKAVGICGSDIPRIYKTGAHAHPLVPGHEMSGTVVKAGSKVDFAWMEQRVGVFPMIPCGTCVPCKNGQYEMCRQYSYLGSRRNGGFAEYVAVPAANLVKLPDYVSFEKAAMLEPMAVAVHAMRRIMPNPSDTVVVCGLGTIGRLLLLFLKELGIKNIFAIGNKDIQKQAVLSLGLSETHYLDIRNEKVGTGLTERTGGRGVDVFFECVGKNETAALAIEHMAPGGQICLVGNPSSEMRLEKDTYWRILRNQLTVTGTWNSSFDYVFHDRETVSKRRNSRDQKIDDWAYVLQRLEKKLIDPLEVISHRFSLEELKQGFHIMRDKTQEFGKIMGIIE